MIWEYLRRKVREAILSGVEDAMAELEGGVPAVVASQPVADLAALRNRLRPAIAAADPEEEASAAVVTGSCANGRGSRKK